MNAVPKQTDRLLLEIAKRVSWLALHNHMLPSGDPRLGVPLVAQFDLDEHDIVVRGGVVSEADGSASRGRRHHHHNSRGESRQESARPRGVIPRTEIRGQSNGI